ncbi:MAG: GDP-mannose 4,6-dehydratase, partial [Patulibacter sp.]|nr:GDP-mannose 4,6-dehydratase [Patulibacter sp.]
FTVFGPRQRPDMAFNIFCQAAIDESEIRIFGDGRQTRDFTFVTDIVAATRAAAINTVELGGSYNVGGGTRVSLRRVIEIIENVAGRALDVSYSGVQLGDVRDTGADTSKARRDLFFEPSTSVEQGIAEEFEWLRQLAPAHNGRTVRS